MSRRAYVDSLRALTPARLTTYLQATGWTELGRSPFRRAVFLSPSRNDEQFEVLAPLAPDSHDYLLRLDDAVTLIAEWEERDRRTLVSDIAASRTDRLEVRAITDSQKSGVISLIDGSRLIKGTRDLLLAAACSTWRPRPYYGNRKPRLATEFLASVELGPSLPGSYLISVGTDLPESTGLGRPEWDSEDAGESFERAVFETLLSGLEGATAATQTARETGSIEEFGRCIEAGTSANLCEALVYTLGKHETKSVEYLIQPALLSSNTALKRRVSVSREDVHVLEAAAEYLRGVESRQGITLVGVVQRLDRELGAHYGTVVLRPIGEKLPPRVRMRLTDSDYRVAIAAHEDGLAIQVTGDLARTGRTWTLGNPYGLERLL